MNDYAKMTSLQAQEEMEKFREVFNVVRLIDADTLRETNDEKAYARRKAEAVEPCDKCYDFWGKRNPCENCVAFAALVGKTQKSKLEIAGETIYQVMARYVEIDGKPYVMELIKRLDDDAVLDFKGHEKLINRLNDYYEKIYKDVLTGAYNRRYYEEQIKQTSLSCGVAMVDLDDFKIYNDVYGHVAGDAVLKAVASVMKKSVRKSDKVIRYGGDEFLLIMPEIHEEPFLRALSDIRQSVHGIDVPGYTEIQVSVSIGGVICENEAIDAALERADKLLYLAKEQKNALVSERDVRSGFTGGKNTKPTVLIVDDAQMNREILTSILKEEFNVIEAENGEEGIRLLGQYGVGISCVLLDIMMPGIDGFGVLEFMADNHIIDDVPVITITGDESEATIRRAYEMGVSDYINRPFDSKVVFRRVFNIVKLYAKQKRLVSIVTSQMLAKEKNSRLLVGILSQIVEFRNGDSGCHVIHINAITQVLLERLVEKTNAYKLRSSDIFQIATASALHDIGKIGIPDEILNKPGKLTPEEFEIMKTHTLIGAEMLDRLEAYRGEQLVRYAHDICRWHHERYDGKGYPDGLKGEEIPIWAQVVALADVYDALVSERVYKKAYPHDVAVKMILNGECGAFNPLLLECFKEAEKTLRPSADGMGGGTEKYLYVDEISASAGKIHPRKKE